MNEPIRSPFVWPIRVYYEDTDAGAVVYHSRYLNMFERARTEWLRAHGIGQAALAREHGLLFAIRRVELEFIRPARLDDLLDVSVEMAAMGAARMEIRQRMTRHGDGALLATADVTAACLTADRFQPTRVPAWIRAEINNAE